MPKVKIHSLHSSEREQLTREFIDFLVGLKSKNDLADVFIGVMTRSEVLMFARRIQVAKELLRGTTQEEIRRILKVGYDNIQNVEKWLYTENPKRDKRLHKEIISLGTTVKASSRPTSSRGGLNRYPEHQLAKQILEKLLS